MAIRHNSQPQSGYLFSAQHYLTNNYSGYSIKPWNPHKRPQTPTVALKHYSVFYNLVSWIKRHTYAGGFEAEGASCGGRREGGRGGGGGGHTHKVTASRNIIKSELFHPAESRATAAVGGADAHSNLGWKDMMFSPAAGEKLLLQGKCGCRRRTRSMLVKQYKLQSGNPPESEKCSNY